MNSANNIGITALHWAAYHNSVDVAKLLLENSANVNSTDSRGQTALHDAAYKNSVDVAKLLIEKSPNLTATATSGRYRGQTPLQVAERAGHQKMVELLKNALTVAIDCQWYDWTNWNTCKGPCGVNQGTKTRTRGVKIQGAHGGQPCAGEDQEMENCTHVLCRK